MSLILKPIFTTFKKSYHNMNYEENGIFLRAMRSQLELNQKSLEDKYQENICKQLVNHFESQLNNCFSMSFFKYKQNIDFKTFKLQSNDKRFKSIHT